METKICPDKNCIFGGQPQPIANFGLDKNTHSGYSAYCKSCKSRRAKERFANNPEAKNKAREANKRYRESEHGRERIKEYYLSSEYREHANEYQRNYRNQPHEKLRQAIKTSRYRLNNRMKTKARQIAKIAVRSGRISFPSLCDWCGHPALTKDLEIHHWRGYEPDFWLDVKFVHAVKCHAECEGIKPEDWV